MVMMFGEICVFRLPVDRQQIAVFETIGAGEIVVAESCTDLVQIQIALGKLG